MVTKQLTSEEADLIDAIRNLQRSFPNGYASQVDYILRLLDKMIDLPK